MQHRFDVDLAVVGAGPAGAACALRAAQHGLRVAVFEPQGAVFDKPCGEGLMPFGVRALAEIGVRPSDASARSFDALRYRIRGATALEVTLAEPGLSMTRPALLAAIAQPLTAHEDRVVRVAEKARVDRYDSAYVVRTVHGANIRSRALAVADGLAGRTAPWLRGPSLVRSSTRVGVRARFETRRSLGHVEIHLAPDCEIYLTPLPGDTINAAVLYERPPTGEHTGAALLRTALERHPHARELLGDLECAPSSRALDWPAPRCVARDGSFLIGDAGGGVDPVLGCGVSLALWSGIRAADGARDLAQGATRARVAEDYRTAWRRAWLARHRLASLLRTLGRRPRIAASLFAAARSSQLLRDGLVRIAAE